MHELSNFVVEQWLASELEAYANNNKKTFSEAVEEWLIIGMSAEAMLFEKTANEFDDLKLKSLLLKNILTQTFANMDWETNVGIKNNKLINEIEGDAYAKEERGV